MIEVKMFAGVREETGATVQLDLQATHTVGDLRQRLCERFPEIAALLSSAAFAIDAEYATDDTQLGEQREIACIPPVSGG